MPANDIDAAKNELKERFFKTSLEDHCQASRKQRRAPKREYKDRAMNILGLGIGGKVTAGSFTGDRAVNIYVRGKISISELPSRLAIPKTVGGIPTDVVEVGFIRSLAPHHSIKECIADPQARQPRPIPGGVSIGGGTNPAGTLGYPVRVRNDSHAYILSNYHVLGHPTDPNIQLDTFQPGYGDGGLETSDRIGRYSRGKPIRFDGKPNTMDAALAQVNEKFVIPHLCNIGILRGLSTPAEFDSVMTFGRTSKVGMGVIKDIDCDIMVDVSGRPALFVGQIRISPMSETRRFTRRGDSGAVVVNRLKRACGLVFAAETTGRATYATPMQRIARFFDFRLMTSTSAG